MISKLKKIIPNKVKRNFKGLLRNVIDSIRYYLVDSNIFSRGIPAHNQKLSSIIFVCKGNVCRSAFAEKRFRDLIDDESVTVDSCGVDVDQGNYPPDDSVLVAEEYDCVLTGRRANGLDSCDVQGADLIFPVEYWQYKRLVDLYPERKNNIKLLRTVAPFPYSLFCNIADPYGWGVGEFRCCYRLVDRCLTNLARRC